MTLWEFFLQKVFMNRRGSRGKVLLGFREVFFSSNLHFVYFLFIVLAHKFGFSQRHSMGFITFCLENRNSHPSAEISQRISVGLSQLIELLVVVTNLINIPSTRVASNR